MRKIKFLTIGLLMSLGINAQVSSMDKLLTDMKYDHIAEEKFGKYVEAKHLFDGQSFTAWKSENKILYFKELWYQSKSFYVKRNQLSEGLTLDESIFDVSRFESYRKEDVESIITFPGFKDVIVLLPNNKLIYKP